MEDFNWISFVFYFLITWAILKAFQVYLKARNAELEKQILDLHDRLNNRIINVKVEKHGDIFYLFDKMNDSFVAQGRTLAEVTNHVDSRFKGAKVILANTEELTAAGLK